MSHTKAEPNTAAPVDTSAESQAGLVNPVRVLATVATQEELLIMKCTNKEQAIAYEKHLWKLTEKVIHWLQKGLNADPEEPQLKDAMLILIKDFKETIAEMYEPVHHVNWKEVLKSIKEPEGECIWNPRDDNDDGQEATAQATVQQEEPVHPEAEEFIQASDEPLSDEQAVMVTDLCRSHTCMLEWQGQVSMLLGKLATSVSPKLYLVILNLTIKPLHQVTLPPVVTTKLTSPKKLRCPSQTEWLAELISPDPEYMKPWANESATLYLAATLHYMLRKAVVGTGNMK